jgi:hypothetical protein
MNKIKIDRMKITEIEINGRRYAIGDEITFHPGSGFMINPAFVRPAITRKITGFHQCIGTRTIFILVDNWPHYEKYKALTYEANIEGRWLRAEQIAKD